MDKLCFLNYTYNSENNGLYVYNYLFGSTIIKILSVDAFKRGEIARISEFIKDDQTIVLDVLDKEEIDALPSNKDIPTLMFLTSRIPVAESTNYEIVENKSIEVLSLKGSIINENKFYTAIVLMRGEKAKVQAINKVDNSIFEWLIKDYPTRDKDIN